MSGAEVLSDPEFWDLLRYCAIADLTRVIPIFDPVHYARQIDQPFMSHVDLLDHFLSLGIADLLSPHPLIEPAYSASLRPDVFGTRPRIEELVDLLAHDLTDPSPFFSIQYYRSQVDFSLDQSSLCHFLREGAGHGLMPCAYFDPMAYRRKYSDVPDDNLGALFHFIESGDRMGRDAGRAFPQDPTSTWKSRAPTGGGPLRDYLMFGRFQALEEGAIAQPADCLHQGPPYVEWQSVVEEDSWFRSAERFGAKIAAKSHDSVNAFREQNSRILADSEAPDALIERLSFPKVANPDVDILIPFYNEFERTVVCLRTIQLSVVTFTYRILLIDDASPDPRVSAFAAIPGIALIRNEMNLHFLRSCNHGYNFSNAPILLLLNNDSELSPNALQILYDALEADEVLGAVGPKLIYPNGRLQESGCSLRPDGTSEMIGVGDDPDRLRYCYPRKVDYISGACLMVRRSLIGSALFDEAFAPAYCEDVDLCLRIAAQGKSVLYCSDAVVVHHLSVSTSKMSRQRRLQMITRNQISLVEKWSERLLAGSDVRVLAFYLPQFHAVPQNDLWWGKGFTEWTNVSRTLPSYVGHYQPHLPADLGFYDLRRVEVMQSQQELADRYGLTGFVVYYYNFGGSRILESPLETLLARPDINFRFCLCWANENWTRHWDGGEKEALLTQRYDEETLDSICQDAVRYAADPRALKVDGKPLFLLYRPLLLPNVAAYAARLRRSFAEAGWSGAYLVYVESMEAVSAGISPASIGFDASVEFPPQGIGSPHSAPLQPIKRAWEGHVYNYEATVLNACARPDVPFRRFPCVFPSWDNTARQPLRGTSFQGAHPELFQRYVRHKVTDVHRQFTGDEKLLFVNAWNEWAEGAHLEPDRAFGHQWLEALRDGIAEARFPASLY